MTASDCPFCYHWNDRLKRRGAELIYSFSGKGYSAGKSARVSVQAFKKHVGRHMLAISLFSLPLSVRQNNVNSEVSEGIDYSTLQGEKQRDEMRCVCGERSWLGPYWKPGRDRARHFRMEGSDITSPVVQCEECEAWQHSKCVGIKSYDMPPESYYCDQCRPDLHMVKRGERHFRSHAISNPVTNNDPSRRSASQGQEKSPGHHSSEETKLKKAIPELQSETEGASTGPSV